MTKRGKRCFVENCFAAAPFASPANPEVHACERHKKRDFVNMRNKRCLAKGCYRNPHYGVSRLIDPHSKAQYCTEHKSPGMQNVNGGRCAGADCSKQPRFSLPGEKGKYCSKHRGEGMVDVLYTPCAAEGCKKHPHFGYVEGGPRFCAQHRAEGMVDVKHRRCAVKGCRKDRVQITPGTRKRGKFCEVHCDGSQAASTSAEVYSPAEQDAASSDGMSSDRKRSRTWGMEADGDYMSSADGSQIGSSTGYERSLSRDNPRAIPTRPVIHATAHGEARPPTAAERHYVPQRMGAGMSRDDTYAPHEGDRNFGSFHQNAGWPPGVGHSEVELDRGEQRGTSRRRFYTDSAEADPYPLFQRNVGQPQKPPASGTVAASPHAVHGTIATAAPAAPFRLRCWEPRPNSLDYSSYPCPWEFTREGQNARWAEGDARGGGPVHEWNGHPSAP